MFLSFQSALKGLTAPSGSWLCNSNRYVYWWEAVHAIDFALAGCAMIANSTKPKRIVCLLKYDWQHFLRGPCTMRGAGELGDGKTPRRQDGKGSVKSPLGVPLRETWSVTGRSKGSSAGALLNPWIFRHWACMNIRRLSKMCYLLEIHWTPAPGETGARQAGDAGSGVIRGFAAVKRSGGEFSTFL